MKLGDYLRETKAELKHVSWPTKQQAIIFSVLVIIVSIVTAVFLGLFDRLFETVLKFIIG